MGRRNNCNRKVSTTRIPESISKVSQKSTYYLLVGTNRSANHLWEEIMVGYLKGVYLAS